MLRRLGCALPIQLWHLGAKEMDGRMQALVAPLGVECVDAFKSRKKYPVRRLHGWELKPYAILHCRFREVLFLDADNVPVVNPEFLFDTPRYQASGAIFWPDYEAGKNEKLTAIWRSCGMRQPDEPEFETGQIVVDKRRCWRALRLSLWFNEHSDFYYRYLHGDKETFHLAFRKLKQSYALVPTPIHRLEGTMCQHDFDGRRIFQHRNTDKWDLFLHNKRVGDFWFEQECRHYVRQLRRAWDGGMGPYAKNGSKTLPFPKRSLGWLKLEAVMISCAERSESRQQTLANLAKTDWDGVPLHVQVHESKAEEDWQAVCAYLALKKALEGRADYILFLEDDLDFNRHIRRNLERWAPVQAKQVTLASLYNPRVRESACDLRNNARIVEPGHVFGSKAFLISQETVRHIVRHWTRVEGGQDIKIARLAGRLRRPIFYHAPSLVQHIKTGEAPEPRFQQAMDFDPDWAA